jgi:glycine/D-amino acid oxidase-like deaminating enzyme
VNARSYWLDTVDERSLPPASALASSAHVVIVGAGYTGLAAARHLARAGASVVVLDRGAIGSGASSRNGGQVLTGLKVDPETLIARYGGDRARALFAIALESIAMLEAIVSGESIACEYARSGHIQAAAKPSHFDAFRREQELLAREFGHDVRVVPRDAQHSELGSDRYFGLSIDERSGAINPAKYVGGLASAACRAGASIVPETTVRRLSRRGSQWTVVTDRGDIAATDVLFATNGYTDGAAPFLQRRLVPIGSYIIATEPLGAELAARLLPRGRMAFDSNHFLYYFRTTTDGRLLFGGRAEFSRPSPGSERRAARVLTAAMARVFPVLRDRAIDYAWSGRVAFTRDQMPHAGRIDGVYFAAGYCGHGVAMATYLGTLIARRMAGELFDHPFMDDRFAAIPFYNGTPWFLPFAGAYYRLRDLLA